MRILDGCTREPPRFSRTETPQASPPPRHTHTHTQAVVIGNEERPGVLPVWLWTDQAPTGVSLLICPVQGWPRVSRVLPAPQFPGRGCDLTWGVGVCEQAGHRCPQVDMAGTAAARMPFRSPTPHLPRPPTGWALSQGSVTDPAPGGHRPWSVFPGECHHH